jgi:hypothetical protein
MGAHIQAVPRKKLSWSHLVEKDEGPNHLSLSSGTKAVNLAAAAASRSAYWLRPHDPIAALSGAAGVI